jgi:hypothetical protein
MMWQFNLPSLRIREELTKTFRDSIVVSLHFLLAYLDFLLVCLDFSLVDLIFH